MKSGGKELSRQTLVWYLTGNLILALILAGGYLQPAAALLCIFLGAALTAGIWKTGKLVFSCDRHGAVLFLIVLMYLASVLWAVDRGMAFGGFIHFLPIFLFYMLLCQCIEEREHIITLLPPLGSLMTLFSFIMMQFPVFKDYVSVAGRLSGFFQYPNTYALFMLVCLIIAAYRLRSERMDWLDVLYCGAALFGIFMSGSRTTFLILLGVLAWFLLKERKIRRVVLPAAVLLLILTVLLGISGIAGDVSGRFLSLSLHSSTLLGRLLYAQDALRLIPRYPFGCGYYGYYFLQTEVQTGVYTVANVHNELIQMMLDIGIVPAVLFYGTLIYNICKKEAPERNRLALLVMLLHSLLDYDFQFLAVWFVLILFLDVKNIKEYPVSMLTKTASAAALAAIVFGAGCVGASDFLMLSGQYEKAAEVYRGNTLAKTYQLTEIEDIQELKKAADSVIESNRHVPLAYHALAQVALSDGKVSDYLKYKEHAIELAPYDADAYTEYLDALSYCLDLYRSGEDEESARLCVEKAQKVPEMLEELREKTSWLGWNIDDVPQTMLPWKYQKLIEEM